MGSEMCIRDRCRDNKLPILVFDLADPDNIAKAVQGENVGTLVYEG